jgi:signal transduction histidine kinase
MDRARQESELRQIQKMESVGRLAAGIAHEINTPIQFVGDNLRFLAEAFGDLTGILAAYRAGDSAAAAAAEAEVDIEFLLAEVPEALGQTVGGIDRVAGIVRAMKAFGHPGEEEKAPVDLNEVVRNTLVVASSEVKYVAEVETDLAELPPVWCHVGDINQVLLNLVVNAAHAVGAAVGATGELGTITVRTRAEGDEAVIDVADTGCGIDPRLAHRVFEPFFTTKQAGSGTGQGLALASSLIVDRHSGSITFSSEPGAGTTFTVRLPVGVAVARGAERGLAEALV